MRRLWASLLLAAFSVPLIGSLIGPALLASEVESKLPSCCRRDGKHSCGMASMPSHDAEPSGPLLRTSRCSQFPGAKAAPSQSTLGVIGNPHGISAAVVSQPAANAQAEILFHVSYNRAGQKRGPPSLLSLA
ncbi:MAG TPA: hypothetical protein VGP79_14910 [Bryobacteraceae bacterium]|nr:hypothetical protein [Bryobacteraceae bacterium]